MRPSPWDASSGVDGGAGIAYSPGLGLFVAVGEPISSGTHLPKIITSPDGIHWTGRSTPWDGTFNAVIRDVTWNGSLFVAVGNPFDGSSCLLSSPDGVAWSVVASPATDIDGAYSVVWTGSEWGIATLNPANAAFPYQDVLSSPDLSSWTWGATGIENFASGFCRLRAVAYGGGQWAAGGTPPAGPDSIYSSPDGITWAPQSSPYGDVFDLAYNGALWVAAGSAVGPITIATSPDLVTWTAQVAPFQDSAWAVTWNGALWVALGDSPPHPGIASSPDAMTWTDETARVGPPGVVNARGGDVAYGGGLWVAVQNWEVPPVPPPLRQRQRDDGLVSTGRVNAGANRPRSLEGSLRQAASNTYR